MQTNVFSLIEELVSMSGSSSDLDSLNSELSLLELDITGLQEDIESLESSMTDDKYFDAAQEVVDRNIELSVSKKLNKLEKEYDELQAIQEDLQSKEKELIDNVDYLKQRIIKAKQTVSIINKRIESSNEESTNEVYLNVNNDENEKINNLQKKLDEKTKDLDELTKEINDLNLTIDKIKSEIEQSTSRLMEVRKNLSNRKNYIDESLKRNDNDSLMLLKDKLTELEAKRLSILTDATYIANEIKELFVADENEKGLKKLLELVTIINSKPFMEINDIPRLEEELAKLEKEQTELINVIENKEYFGNDIKYLDNRISHLKELISAKKLKIEAIKDEIDNIDNVLVINIIDELTKAENEADELEKSINNYHDLLKTDAKKSSNTLIALKTTYNKKNSELKIINDIIDKYSKELNELITNSVNLETEKIRALEAEIHGYETEIEELNKVKMLSAKTKDAIEQENDKNNLKELSDKINILKQKISFNKTPQEIYDQIEMIINSKKTSVTAHEVSSNIENISNNDTNLEIQSDEDSSNTVETPLFIHEDFNDEATDLKESPIVEEVEKDTFNLTNEAEIKDTKPVIEEPLFSEFNNFELPDYNEVNDEITTLNAENLKEDTEINAPIDEEEEYTFSELEDTNYFSLDEFLKNLDSQKEE